MSPKKPKPSSNLISGADILSQAVFVHPSGNIGRLLVQCEHNRASLIVESLNDI